MAEKAMLRILRKNMKAYIDAEPLSITLKRATRSPSGNGGFKKGPLIPLSNPQTFRLEPFKRRVSNFIVNTQDGDIPEADFVLIGEWNADVERWDEFTLDDVDYTVLGIEMKSNNREFTDRVVVEVIGKAKGLAWQTSDS